MTDRNSTAYYVRRAATAHALAAKATSSSIREIHLHMAQSYERMAAAGVANDTRDAS
jgi:hypothetical protein